MKINVILVEQNGIEFYIGSINFKDFKDRFEVIRRNESEEGIQRNLEIKRLQNIREFIKTGNSIFPQPIIVSLNNECYSILELNGSNNLFEIHVKEEIDTIGEIIDGQHRWEGMKESLIDDINLPIIFFLDISLYEKAYIFKTINGNQKPINKSHLYDLYELSSNRSPEKIMHIIVKKLNTDKDSPFYKRVKMLGQATNKHETISQGTMITYLLKLITSNSEKDRLFLEQNKKLEDNDKYPLRKYFISEKDELILKIINNYFLAVSELYYDEWNNTSKYVFLRTVGFGGLCRFARIAFEEKKKEKDLSKEAFIKLFNSVRKDEILSIFDQRRRLMGEAGQKIICDDLTKLLSMKISNF